MWEKVIIMFIKSKIIGRVKSLLKQRNGQALEEYALIIALVALLTVASLNGMRDGIITVLETISSYFNG